MNLSPEPGFGAGPPAGGATAIPGTSRTDRYLVALIVTAGLSSLLAFYSLGFAYQALLAGAGFLLIGRRACVSPLTRGLVTLFGINLVTICIASIIYNEELGPIVTVVGRYWGPVLFVCLLMSARVEVGDFYFRCWYQLLLVLTAIAYAQYFFSPTLWGLLPLEHSTLTEWSEGKSFQEYAVFYRATSLLGSPQVWGLYAALSIFVLSARLKGSISSWSLVFLWGGALLSGNKVSGIILLAFLAMRAARRPCYLFLILGVPLLVYLVAGFDAILEFRALEHIFNISDMAEQEQGGRLAIWAYVLGNINMFLGGGASFVKNLSEIQHFVAESYLLQSWAEATIVFPAVFLFFIARIMLLPSAGTQQKIFGFLLLVATVASHAFSHPAFIVIWPVLAGLDLRRKV
jgi:hypothetical protein